MYKIFESRVEDFSVFLGKIPSFGAKSADISEILKIFETFYKNVQNFEKQLKNTVESYGVFNGKRETLTARHPP